MLSRLNPYDITEQTFTRDSSKRQLGIAKYFNRKTFHQQNLKTKNS